MNRARCLSVAVAAIAALVLAACGGSSHKDATTPTPTPTPTLTTPPPPTSSTPTPPAAAPVSPLTGGKPSANGVVAVKIDDTGNGRPQRNIDKADIVYIEEVEGGLSRLLAVFNTSLPTVEAVRSTRAGDPEVLAQYGPIAYVASGGAANPLAVLAKSNLKATINDKGGPGFRRDSHRGAPYNLTANLATVAKALKAPKAKDVGFTWSASTAQAAAGPVATDIRTTVGATNIEFRYNAKLKRYVRVIGGVVQHTAAGALIDTPNVIVQFCSVTTYLKDIDVNGNPNKYTHTIGSGKAVVFRNGHRIDGTWSRPKATSGTTFKAADGKQIALAPGGAWVVLVARGVGLRS